MKGRDRAKDLLGALAAVEARGFDWRSRNCGLGAASLAAAVLKRDLAAPYRKECSSMLAAMRLLKDRGGFPGIMAELGLAEVKPVAARRGDVALYVFEVRAGHFREALGTALDYRAVFPGPDGLVYVPLARCSRAWRLPDEKGNS
jgi:hypothetical protein